MGPVYAVKVTVDPKGTFILLECSSIPKWDPPSGNRGFYEDRVEFCFEVPSNGTKFAITRPVKATVTVEAHRHQLAPIAPYVRPQRRRRERRGPVTDGTRPSNYERQKTAWLYRIPEFKIPVELSEIFKDGTVDSKVEKLQLEHIPLDLGPANYGQFWQTLLWAEEHQAQ